MNGWRARRPCVRGLSLTVVSALVNQARREMIRMSRIILGGTTLCTVGHLSCTVGHPADQEYQKLPHPKARRPPVSLAAETSLREQAEVAEQRVQGGRMRSADRGENIWRAAGGSQAHDATRVRVPAEPARRASPPRPSLLCGDLDNCQRVYDGLQRRAAELMLSEAALEVPRAHSWQQGVATPQPLEDRLAHPADT
jgi:hypothetical protein